MSKVSVIIPVYNTEKYLKRCIDSILNQTYHDIEIIVINDGSTDNSLNLLKQYSNNINLINQENQGQAVARNNGISKATGDFLLFVDSDDWIDKNMIKDMVECAENHNFDIVLTDYYVAGKDTIYQKGYERLNNPRASYMLSNPGPCFKLFNRQLFIDNNVVFLANHIYEDLAIIPSLGLYTDKIGFIDKAYYYYFVHENSTMKQTVYNSKLEDVFMAVEHLSNKFNNQYREELEFIYIRHLLLAASLRFLDFKNQEAKQSVVKISNIMHEFYPNWKSNKYLDLLSKKEEFLSNLFYKKCYFLYKFYKILQKIK